jgi:C-terminal processing protease CtpA/Prc
MSSLLGSPADRAGLRLGDLLVGLNGLPVLFATAADCYCLLETARGNRTTLQLER